MTMQIDPMQKEQEMNIGNHNSVILAHYYMFDNCFDTTLFAKHLHSFVY